MGRITTGIGLVSGINSRDIIDQLMALEARPKKKLETRIDQANQQKLAYTDLRTRLASLKITATTLKKPSTFQAAVATSSNEDVLTATAGIGAAVGSYQMQVARLVTTQQTVSRGFASTDSRVGAGTLTIEMGGGELKQQNLLSELNGGQGVRRGSFRITDRSGSSTVIDISSAVSLEDVIRKINTNLSVQVRASMQEDRLVLTDLTGQTTGDLVVQDLGDSMAAFDLGISGSSGGTDTLSGRDIQYLGRNTALSFLNDGRGVRRSGGNEFSIDPGDAGGPININLGNARTVGEVLDIINTTAAGRVVAELSPGANFIRLTGAAGDITVTAIGDSKAAADLGLLGTSSGGTMNGRDVLAGLGTVLISSLNGGRGLELGRISIDSRGPGGPVEIDLSGSKTVAEMLARINHSGAGVTAALNASGNGIQITDTTGATGNLTITDVTGTTAVDLGIAGTFGTDVQVVKGTNLQRQWVSENTLLSSYNGGRGVGQGKFTITNSMGRSATIEIRPTMTRLGDVIDQINSRGLDVLARINDTGDGIVIEDNAGGIQKLLIKDTEGSVASELRIAGTGDDTNRIHGSLEKTVEISATDTLQDVMKKINDLNFGVSASIVNDGSSQTPFRLALYARNSGMAGRVTFDAGTTQLDTRNLVEAQDAAVFLGGTGSEQPLLITAGRNQLSGVIRGVNIELTGVSDKPVTLNITGSSDNVISELEKFTENFNAMVDKLKELTKFDVKTNERGLLLGETAVQTIQTEMYAMLSVVNTTGGKYRVLSDIGLKVGEGAKLEFDPEKFRAAWADDPQAVARLFTAVDASIGPQTRLNQLNEGRGIRTTSGPRDFTITLADETVVDVSLREALTIRDIIETIRQSSDSKVQVEITSDGQLRLTDLTSGPGTFALTAQGGSQALFDLGLSGQPSGNVLTGLRLRSLGGPIGGTGGAGWSIERRIDKLIDPVSGVITRQNQNLDERTLQFENRIKSLDKLLESKRARLERQFASLESVLSNLQNQQQAISQIRFIEPIQRRRD